MILFKEFIEYKDFTKYKRGRKGDNVLSNCGEFIIYQNSL